MFLNGNIHRLSNHNYFTNEALNVERNILNNPFPLDTCAFVKKFKIRDLIHGLYPIPVDLCVGNYCSLSVVIHAFFFATQVRMKLRFNMDKVNLNLILFLRPKVRAHRALKPFR